MTHFTAPERLVTDDFVLRCPMPGEGPEARRVAVASYDHLKTFVPWADPDVTPQAVEEIIRGARARFLTSVGFTTHIWSPDESRMWGGVGFQLRGRPVADAYAEVGMWIAADQAGRGLGTKVLEAVLAWGFTEWPWQRLEWRCNTRNEASAAIARKAGMRHEATLRGVPAAVDDSRCDDHVFGLTRSDWETASRERADHD